MILCFRGLNNPINLFNLCFFIVGTRRALSAGGSFLEISTFAVFGQRTRCPYIDAISTLRQCFALKFTSCHFSALAPKILKQTILEPKAL